MLAVWLCAMTVGCGRPVDSFDIDCCLEVKRLGARATGWATKFSPDPVSLAQGQAAEWSFNAHKGLTYRLQGCTEDPAANLDVLLYRNGELIGRDDLTLDQDGEPVFRFEADQGGIHQAQLYLRRGPEGGASTMAALVLERLE